MNIDQIKRYLTAGRSTLTLKSLASGTHYTYRVYAAADRATGIPSTSRFFVSLLTGTENDNDRHYRYLGMLFADSGQPLVFRLTEKSLYTGSTPGREPGSLAGFRWLVKCVNEGYDISNSAEVYHAGKCGACGRTLTTPQSIESGLGPVCASKRMER